MLIIRTVLFTPNTLIVMLISLPLIFSSGIIWPAQLLPEPINFIAQLIPATPGMQAFVHLNQMGADFRQVFPLFQQMLVQAAGYFVLAWWLLLRRQRALAGGLPGGYRKKHNK